MFTLRYDGKFKQENTYQILSQLASFCERYDVFSVHSSNCRSLANREC